MKPDEKVQYPAAYDEHGVLWEALSFKGHEEEARCRKYHCIRPGCNEEMRPVMGQVREYHFRHLGKPCEYNHWLHEYAKQVFLEEYKLCLDRGIPFMLELTLPVKCNKACLLKEHFDCKEHYETVSYDLTKYFKSAEPEKRVQTDNDRFRRPDVLLSREDGRPPLWIEICVTHETRPLEKPELGSIVEIKINTKEDVQRIFRKRRIVQSDDKKNWVRLHGFDSVELNSPMKRRPPCEDYYIFEVPKIPLFGNGVCSRTIPKRNNWNAYTLALYLNWGKAHNGDCEDIPIQYTREELNQLCQTRFEKGDEEPFLLASLIKSESRNAIFRPFVIREPSDPVREVRPAKKIKPIPVVEEPEVIKPEPPSPINWIDLGLPSGTLWADRDGYDTSQDSFYQIPSRRDISELRKYCEQSVSDDGKQLILTNPSNGKTLSLNAKKYKLADRGRDYVYCVNIYGFDGINYLHEFTEDLDIVYRVRLVRKTNPR